MLLTLGQAAQLIGVNRTTLNRAIKNGRLSAQRRDDGAHLIDPAELERVYTIRRQPDAQGVHDAMPQHAQPQSEARIAALEAELRGVRELLAEVRTSRDTLQNQLQQALAALPPPRRSWWPWRRSA